MPAAGTSSQPSVIGNRRIRPLSDLPRSPSSIPDIFPAPGAQASAATRPCLLCLVACHGGRRLSMSIRLPRDPRWSPPGTRHGGCHLSRLDPSAACSTAEQPRSAARSATPRPARASVEAHKAHRKAKDLTKQREDLLVRLAYRKRVRELTSMQAKATAATSVFFK